ncbi:MAG: hypothetical protein IJI37_03265 [Opitutales bacterium]|nr:hypothetical protein [Opitutales bacterium]
MEIFVGNLPFDITEGEIREKFGECGTVSSVKMLTDKLSGRFRGIAFVSFDDDEQAKAAVEKLNGADLGGRPMRVDISRSIDRRFNGFGAGFAPKRPKYGESSAPRRPKFGGFRPRGNFGENRAGENRGGEGDGAPRQKFGGFKRPFGKFSKQRRFDDGETPQGRRPSGKPFRRESRGDDEDFDFRGSRNVEPDDE